jgi:hypothetical protein
MSHKTVNVSTLQNTIKKNISLRVKWLHRAVEEVAIVKPYAAVAK